MSSATRITRKASRSLHQTPNLRDPRHDTATDYELLAKLLSYSHGCMSAKPLLRRFQSLGHVLSAEPGQLAEFGATSSDLALFRLVRAIACKLVLGEVQCRPVFGNYQAVLDYCRAAMCYEQVEHFRVLFLDRKNKLIVDQLQLQGTVDHTPVYPREVVKRALLLNASAIILVHNHPSGDPKPSRDDVEMTRKLRDALKAVGIELHEHLVIGHGEHASFRTLGLL